MATCKNHPLQERIICLLDDLAESSRALLADEELSEEVEPSFLENLAGVLWTVETFAAMLESQVYPFERTAARKAGLSPQLTEALVAVNAKLSDREEQLPDNPVLCG